MNLMFNFVIDIIEIDTIESFFIEEKILAIEEIRREESKSKMLAMASMAAGIIFI